MSINTNVVHRSKTAGAAAEAIRDLVQGGAFLNGAMLPVTVPFDVREVESNTLLGQVEASSESLVHCATVSARQARLSRWELWERQDVLNRASSKLSEIGDDAALIIAAEGIKTITEARQEVDRAVQTLRLSASAIDHHVGESLNLNADKRGAGRSGYYTRSPLGVVAAITPFNDPLNLVAHKVGPALAAGNAVVVKPAEQTPFSALLLARLLHESGAPAGILSVIPGGAETGRALLDDTSVDAISFTGGTQVGTQVSDYARGRKVVLELGGNNVVIVAEDSDLVKASTASVAGAFSAAGQNCLSVQRVYVHSSIAERFTRMVVEKTKALSVGTKFDISTDVGPMISDAAVATFRGRVNDAVNRGARIRIGGCSHGRFVQPTVLTAVDEESSVFTEECFAPLMNIVSYDDWTLLP